MRKSMILAIILITAIAYGSATAQTTKIVFGPLESDSAGVIRAYEKATVDVGVWIRTEPGINITALHLPLSSKDLYIQSESREGEDLYYPFPLWDYAQFLPPNNDPGNNEYTNQSILAVKDFPTDPFPENGINTGGEWWLIARFTMTATDENNWETYCDALAEGFDPFMDGIVLADFYQGELDPSQYELDFACLRFEQFCGDYILGDYNGSGSVNIADIISAYSYLITCAPDAAVMCQCPPGQGEEFAVAFDLNNSCTFNIADIYAFMRYLPDMPWMLEPCEYCQPPE